MPNLDRRQERLRLSLGLTVAQFKNEASLLGALERDLNLWGTPLPNEPTKTGIVGAVRLIRYRFAIIVGHRKDRDGVYAPAPLKTGEWAWNNEIALEVERRFKNHPWIDVKVFYRRARGGSYSREIDDVYERVDEWIGKLKGATAELHFNDLRTKNSPVNGVGGKETIYSGSSAGKDLARIFHDSNSLPIKNRGLKIRAKGSRGGRSVHVSKHPSVLLEPFDALNPKNNKLAFEHGIDGFADDMGLAIMEYFLAPLTS